MQPLLLVQSLITEALLEFSVFGYVLRTVLLECNSLVLLSTVDANSFICALLYDLRVVLVPAISSSYCSDIIFVA
jgi:hypothetical protein